METTNMVASVVETLRARLVHRRAAIRSIGELSHSASHERVSWNDAVSCWWLRTGDRRVDVSTREAFAAGAEALVLLTALARIDYAACLEEVRAIREDPPVPGGFRPDTSSPPGEVVLAIRHTVLTLANLAPIVARMYGAQLQSSPTFQEDVACLPAEEVGIQVQPIPVKLDLYVAGDALTSALRQIREHVDAQQLQFGKTEARIKNTEVAVARFEIVEVCVATELDEVMNVDTLALLVELQERGVHVPALPPINEGDDSVIARQARTLSFHALIPPRPRDESALTIGIERVYASHAMATQLAAPLFSAIQASCTVDSVELRVDSDIEPDTTSLHQWAAYALFSRHAQHSIESVIIHEESLLNQAIETMQQVLRAENPLALLFPDVDVDEQWIEASRFGMEHPDDVPNDGEGMFVDTREPLIVRVLSQVNTSNAVWWRVLLPGCGEAWVHDSNATVIASPVDHELPQAVVPFEFQFDCFGPDTVELIRSFLRLVPQLVRSVELQTFGLNDEEFDATEDEVDMTDWVVDVLRICPNLERLELPFCNTIANLGIFVDAAIAGHSHLRDLALACPFDTDATDIIPFLEVLSDMTHPLTKTLEELSLHAAAPVRPTRDFASAWARMLQHNRRLHSIYLFVSSDHPIEQDTEDVIIRSNPLDIDAKLAFLSVVHDTSGAASRLDTSVIGMVFEFAAEYRIREIHLQITRNLA